MAPPLASVIILSYNGLAYLGPCLSAVLKQDYPNFEVIVVDNGSTDGSAELVAEQFPQVKLIRNDYNMGFAGGNNVGLRAATGDVLVLLNQDTVVDEGWLTALVKSLQDPTVGIVGCKIRYPNGAIQHAGAYISETRGVVSHIGRNEADTGQYDQPQDVELVTGAALALSRQTLLKIGPLDEGFAPAYYEDCDWCFRARAAGLRVYYNPQASLVHYESTTTRADNYLQKTTHHYGRLRFLLKHKPLNWLWQELAPAEKKWVTALGPTIELMAARDAYLRLALSLPSILAFRMQAPHGVSAGQDSQLEWQSLLHLVTAWRNACLQPESSPNAEAQPGQAPLSDPSLAPLWQTLQTEWELKEYPFQSQVPLIGPGIVAFRQGWNNIAARWYVLPIIQQQRRFNAAAMNLLAAAMNLLAAVEAKNTRQDNQTMREINALAQKLLQLEQEIERLQNRLEGKAGGKNES
ncbi:MAG: glycosyltransferase family 2 protein [Chloroflexi bacterium]|nr:MAG: glycosyltransferase family 2 protein [Chloroflexota bacterium]